MDRISLAMNHVVAHVKVTFWNFWFTVAWNEYCVSTALALYCYGGVDTNQGIRFDDVTVWFYWLLGRGHLMKLLALGFEPILDALSTHTCAHT